MEMKTHPFEISMDNTRYMEIFKASCDVLQLRARSAISSWSIDDQWSHQANPVCFLILDVAKYVSIRHQLRYHRKLSGARFDFNRKKPKDVRVRRVHPNYAFLAESLCSVFFFDQLLRMVQQTALSRTSWAASTSFSRDMRMVFTATSIPFSVPFRISANPPLAIISFPTLYLKSVVTLPIR